MNEMDTLIFGNWQEFLDKAVINLQSDVEQFDRFKDMITDRDRICFAGQFKTNRL